MNFLCNYLPVSDSSNSSFVNFCVKAINYCFHPSLALKIFIETLQGRAGFTITRGNFFSPEISKDQPSISDQPFAIKVNISSLQT